MTEQGIPMDLTGWFAAMVPQGTPRPVVEQINKWFAEIVALPEPRPSSTLPAVTRGSPRWTKDRLACCAISKRGKTT